MDTQINAQDLKNKITNYIEELARETDVARKSESMQKYLEFVAKFHKYSPTNIMLILLEKPNATQVAGFQAWKKMNRWVRKGESGIAILAPMVHKEDPNNDLSPKILSGFRIVYVFDVSQTEGETLPSVPDWRSPEKHVELTEKLLKFAESKGITVTFKELANEVQGVSKGGEIEIDPSAGVKTLIHEIAHELLHRDGVRSNRSEKEWEAESTACIVSKYFGIENLNSPNYLLLHDIKKEDFAEINLRVVNCAQKIISELISETHEIIEGKYTEKT